MSADRPDMRPVLLVLSGPSGAGKSTVVDRYVALHPRTSLIVSATTRAPREGEVDGEDYIFMQRDEFEAKVADQGFLEHAEVHGNYYGTPRDQVDAARAEGLDVLLEIDVQGGRQVQEVEADTVLCFLTPPDPSALKQRLHGRGTDRAEVIAKRLVNAVREYEAMRHYDYLVVNDEVDRAAARLRAVVEAERSRLGALDVGALVKDFTDELTR